ncbi:unnamed protein product, partial [marine sediment metagenome]
SDDFIVVGGVGEYIVKVNNNLSKPFIFLGYGLGNSSYDLSATEYDFARYIQIEYRSGDFVEIDAVEAIYYNIPTIESDAPIITPIDDFWVLENLTSVQLNWEVTDQTPWNYSISVDNIIVESNQWDGEDVDYEYTVSSTGNISISLKVFDFFSNYAVETVIIEVLPVATSKTTFQLMIFITATLLITGLSIYVKRKLKKF